MTDRKLMQMALDALEAMQSYARAEKKGLRICDESIEALRDRLAQPKLVDFTEYEAEEISKGRATILAVPELLESAGWTRKREWVGLTDDEAWGMLGQMSLGASVEDVRLIEAKLKEKNYG